MNRQYFTQVSSGLNRMGVSCSNFPQRAAGTAALCGKWCEGTVTGHFSEPGNFLLYEVQAKDCSSFASAHVNPRLVSPVSV